MTVLGVDLAADARKTCACVLEVEEDALRAKVHQRCGDALLRELAEGREKIAIDAPFGWPREFVIALNAHRRHEAWPAPDDGAPAAFRAALSFRATDRIVMHTRRPLSVSADKLGVTAMRCAHLLHGWSSAGGRIDRSGGGRFVEVYPAGALVRWGLGASGYKGDDTTPLAALLDAIRTALPDLQLSEGDEALCATDDDAFDALVAALVGRAVTLGLTDLPSVRDTDLAMEEGWIHLPLRGSLPLLSTMRRDTRSRPAQALAECLRSGGLQVDDSGYLARFEDALMPGLSGDVREAVVRDLSGKGGSELVAHTGGRVRFQAAHSSAALAANVFGPWLVERRGLPIGDATFVGETHLEVRLPTGLRGTSPTLDCVIEGPADVLAVESKLTETFTAHEADFADAYDDLVTEVADRSWADEFRRLREDPRRYRYLDAAQLLKHHLGLRRNYEGRHLVLAYLYWEPENAAEVRECVVHRAEVAEFAAQVNRGSARRRVEFLPVSYRELWDAWAAHDADPSLREHAAALRRRYVVRI